MTRLNIQLTGSLEQYIGRDSHVLPNKINIVYSDKHMAYYTQELGLFNFKVWSSP